MFTLCKSYLIGTLGRELPDCPAAGAVMEMELGLPLDSPHDGGEEGGQVVPASRTVLGGALSVRIFWVPFTF